MRLQHAVVVGFVLLPSTLLPQQRPWQPTDYYRLNVVSNPALAPDGGEWPSS